MRTTIALSLVMAAGAAHAEAWVKTYGNEVAVEYVDVDSIKKTDGKASASFKRTYLDVATNPRRNRDANGKTFQFTQSRSEKTYECQGNRHTIDRLWDVSADGQSTSEPQSYSSSGNNDTWDKAAKAAVCK